MTTDESIIIYYFQQLIAIGNQYCYLKGLGHAILGNFNTDQMVIELTNI